MERKWQSQQIKGRPGGGAPWLGCPPSPAPSGGGWSGPGPGQGAAAAPQHLLAGPRLRGQAARAAFSIRFNQASRSEAVSSESGLTGGIRAVRIAHAPAAEPPAGPGTRVPYGVRSSAPGDLLPARPALLSAAPARLPAPFLPGQWSRAQTALSSSPASVCVAMGKRLHLSELSVLIRKQRQPPCKVPGGSVR